MHRRIVILCTLVLCHFLFIPWVCHGDETVIFTTGKTNALIILDLSGSMDQDPTGYFCYTAGCTKREMAREAIRQILDNNGDGNITQADQDGAWRLAT